MLTADIYAALIKYGANAWDCGFSTARPSSDARNGLQAYLMQYQNGMCAFCGGNATQPEMCHIVPGGTARKGFMAGNIAIGCRECNEIDADNVVAFKSILRRDLIATKWPTMVELTHGGKAIKIEKQNALNAKRAKRGL